MELPGTSDLDEQTRTGYPNIKQLTVTVRRHIWDENSNRKCIKATAFQALDSEHLLSKLSIATMVFKKSLSALVITLPIVLGHGMNLFFSKNVHVVTMKLQLCQVKYDPTRRNVTSLSPSRPICLKIYSKTSVVIRSVFYPSIISIYLKTFKAHGALRLAFHDAIGFSPTLG